MNTDENCFLTDQPLLQMGMSAADEPTEKKKIVIKKQLETHLPVTEQFNIEHIAQALAKLTKYDALEMLDRYEEDTDYTFFLRGGVLSVIRKNEYYNPHPSFEKWVEANTTLRRSTAHALATAYFTGW